MRYHFLSLVVLGSVLLGGCPPSPPPSPPPSAPIGNLEVGERSSCLTRFDACADLDGYESLVRAFYLYVNENKDSPPASPVTYGRALFYSDDLRPHSLSIPTITTPEGTIDPSAFVTVENTVISEDPGNPTSLPDVLVVSSPFVATGWANVNAGGEGFVLITSLESVISGDNSPDIYVVNIEGSLEDTAPACTTIHTVSDACITVRNNIGHFLDAGPSTGLNPNGTLYLYVLGSGFVMLKVLFPDDLNAKRMFDIVTNVECRDSGYFSFECVVKGDNIDISSFASGTSSSPIGTLEVVGSSCLTGFNACETLGGYEPLARAFYLYVDTFDTSETPEPATIGTLISGDNTALGEYFPTITTSGGNAINPLDTSKPFVTLGVGTNPFPDVLVLPIALSAAQWNTVGPEGFVLANDVTNFDEYHTSSNIYVVSVDYSADDNAPNCSAGYANICIAVRSGIGSKDSSTDKAQDLYVLGSGFVMLKVLFPTVLDAKRMFDIVTNGNCHDSGNYFSFECVVNEDNDNIDISSFIPSISSPIGTLILKIEGGRPSCLTGFNACVTLGGYESLARAFYLYVDDFTGTQVPTTIGTTLTDGSTVLGEYFPTITPPGGDIDPSAFVTVADFDVSTVSSLPSMLMTENLGLPQWENVSAGGEGFVLANDVRYLTAADNGSDLYITDVSYSTEEDAPNCSEGNADACITVRNGIGSKGDTINSTLDLYVLGSGFAMLKVLFPDNLDAEGMFDIVTNAECRDTNGYFSFECLVIDNTRIVPTVPEEERPFCLTGFNACVTLGGYEEIAQAFYLYVDGFTGTQVSTTIGTTLTNGSTVLGGYFPTITTSGGDIAPSAFVTVEAITVSGDADNAFASLPDVLVVPEALDATQWSNVSAEGGGFVLANDVEILTEETYNIYIIDVNYSAEDDALSCSAGFADACITVRENIGALLNSDGTVSTGTSSTVRDLYVLGSGFAMLKVLFPDDLDAEGMFNIVINDECRDTNGYFSFECLVIDNTRIVPTVPEEESTSGEASSSQNKPLTSAFARLLVRSLAARHAPSKDGTYFTQEKTVLEEGSILITQQGTSATSGTSVGGTSVRAIRMRAVYRGEGASVGTLVGAYHYNHTLSALSRDAVDMRVELGMVGDVDVLSGMKLYGHILGVYETGVLTVAFGEHRVDRMMGVGVVGLSYRVSSGANVLADAAIEGRCSVGNAVWVAGSVAYASSFCDTILKLRISF